MGVKLLSQLLLLLVFFAYTPVFLVFQVCLFHCIFQISKVYGNVDPVWLAMSKLRRRNYDEAIRLCTQILAENPYDRVFDLKMRMHRPSVYIYFPPVKPRLFGFSNAGRLH